MVEEFVVDASVLVASFLENEDNHSKALAYIEGLSSGEYIFHLPRLASIETLAAINRQTRNHSQAFTMRAHGNFERWQAEKKNVVYDLEEQRTTDSIAVALRDNLKGSDAIYAASAEELNLELKSFDKELLQRFQGQVST